MVGTAEFLGIYLTTCSPPFHLISYSCDIEFLNRRKAPLFSERSVRSMTLWRLVSSLKAHLTLPWVLRKTKSAFQDIHTVSLSHFLGVLYPALLLWDILYSQRWHTSHVFMYLFWYSLYRLEAVWPPWENTCLASSRFVISSTSPRI